MDSRLLSKSHQRPLLKGKKLTEHLDPTVRKELRKGISHRKKLSWMYREKWKESSVMAQPRDKDSGPSSGTARGWTTKGCHSVWI